MIPFLSYLLKANIVLLLLYGFYFLCLRRDTFYGTIRWYLLAVLVAAVVFPLVDVSGWLAESPAVVEASQYVPTVETVYQVYQYVIEPQPMEYVATEAAVPEKISVGRIIFWCWLPVAALLFAKRLLQLVSLAFLYFRSQKQLIGMQVIVAVTRNIQPFSFAGRIFLNPSLYTNEELNEIITHERVHCRHVHSLDVLFAELIVCLCWFNPLAWLLRNAIRQNLEYYTDRSVLQTGLDRKHYQYSLLRVSGNTYQIVNHFHINYLKKRIIMMNKKNSPRFMAVKYLLVVPALMAVLLVVQMSGLQAAEEYLSRNVSIADEDPKGSDYIIAEDASVVKKAKASTNTQNAKISNDPAIMDSDLELILSDSRAIADGTTMTKFTNDTCIKNEDITYFVYSKSLARKNVDGSEITLYTTSKVDSMAFRNISFSKKLIIIDGKEGSVNNIQPQSVEKIEILNNESATRIYGTKGENGVVLITTKRGTTPESQSGIDPDYRDRQGVSQTQDGENDLTEYNNKKILERKTKRSKVPPFLTGMTTKLGDDPLVLIDECINDFEALSRLATNDIADFSILESGASVLYGEKAKDGAIIVTTKSKTFNGIFTIGMGQVSYAFNKKGPVVGRNGQVFYVDLDDSLRYPNISSKNPLIIIDDREVKAQSLAALPPEDIDNFSILQGATAVTVYGDKAKNGAIVIKTKDKE